MKLNNGFAWVVERLYLTGWHPNSFWGSRQQARDQIADEAGRSKALRAMFRVRKYVRVEE